MKQPCLTASCWDHWTRHCVIWLANPDQQERSNSLLGTSANTLQQFPGVNRIEMVNHCINQPHLWQHFQVLGLTEIMQMRASGDPVLNTFDKWTLSICNGSVMNGAMPIPLDMLKEIQFNTKEEPRREAESMKKFCQLMLPDIEINFSRQDSFKGRSTWKLTVSKAWCRTGCQVLCWHLRESKRCFPLHFGVPKRPQAQWFPAAHA